MITCMSDWICELCYKPADGDLPESWDLVWQSAICPDCQDRAIKAGVVADVVGGCYAFAKDPREKVPNEG